MLHRFRDKDLKNEKNWKIVGKMLLEWTEQFKDRTIYWISYGHTDEGWMKNECIRAGLVIPAVIIESLLTYLKQNWIFRDACALARTLLNSPRIGLESLAKRYNMTLYD